MPGCRTAAASASPSPVLVARTASDRSLMANPHVVAVSTTAVPSGSSSHEEPAGAPSGPVTTRGCRTAPGVAAPSTSAVPSPPSAMGSTTTSSLGRTSLQPSATARDAAGAPTVPLKESRLTRTVNRGVVMKVVNMID